MSEVVYGQAEYRGICAVCMDTIAEGDLVRELPTYTVHAECDQDRLDCPFCGGQILEGREPHEDCLADYLASEDGALVLLGRGA